LAVQNFDNTESWSDVSLITRQLMVHVHFLTEKLAQYLQSTCKSNTLMLSQLRSLKNFQQYPGKLDHTLVLAFKVGALSNHPMHASSFGDNSPQADTLKQQPKQSPRQPQTPTKKHAHQFSIHQEYSLKPLSTSQ